MKTAGVLTAIAGCLLSGSASAQQASLAGSLGLFIYPSGGQAAEQQRTDETECYDWARQTTGINPQSPPSAQQPAVAAQEDTGAAAARGAMGGAARAVLLANATDNDWEEAAALGVVFGGRRGGNSARQRNAQAQKEASAAQQQASQQEVQQFKNAFSACIEGRNYTIK